MGSSRNQWERALKLVGSSLDLVTSGARTAEQLADHLQSFVFDPKTGLYIFDVDYDEFRTIRKDRYAFLGDVKTSDVPEVESGTKPVRFRELEFDHDPSDQEVLDKAEAENCRQPSRAEAETYIRRFSAEQLGKNPRVGLIGPGVRRGGDLRRVSVVGRDDGVDLRWDWAEARWVRRYRFGVVCKYK